MEGEGPAEAPGVQFVGEFSCTFEVDVGDDDECAAVRQSPGQFGAEALGAAGNQGDAALDGVAGRAGEGFEGTGGEGRDWGGIAGSGAAGGGVVEADEEGAGVGDAEGGGEGPGGGFEGVEGVLDPAGEGSFLFAATGGVGRGCFIEGEDCAGGGLIGGGRRILAGAWGGAWGGGLRGRGVRGVPRGPRGG